MGQELAFILNFHLSAHSDILTGWSRLAAGDYLKNTATTPGQARSPELFYLMYNYRW